MALSVARALLRAQAHNMWNRAARESGAAGPVASAMLLVLMMLILAVPGFLVFQAGQDLGTTLSKSPDPASLLRWNAFQALFTVGFALCGSFRQRPTFRFTDLGWLPVPPAQMLVAELPASLFEVFPILATAGIVCSNLGFAMVRPDLSGWLVLLTLQGIAFMVAILMIAASFRRLTVKRRVWAVPVALLAGAFVLLRAAGGLRLLVREWGVAMVSWLPGSQGYAGLAGASEGRAGVGRIVLAILVTAVLVGVAARLLHREAATEAVRLRRRSAGSGARRFRTPATAVAWLFLKQLLDSKVGRLALFTPLLITVSLAVPVWTIRRAVADDRVIPEDLVALSGRLDAFPMLSVFLFVIVAVNAQVWMNQFGWDGFGVRTLLLQPIAMRDTLLGKALGVLGFVGVQVSVGIFPLLWAFPPSWPQVVAAVAGAGSALVVAIGFGHFVSARFPRLVSPDSTAGIPFFLSWIPLCVMVLVGGIVVIVNEIAAAALAGSEPLALVGLLAALLLGYYLALPSIGNHVAEQQEHLLQMA